MPTLRDIGNYDESLRKVSDSVLQSLISPVRVARNYNMADYQYEVIMGRIKDFEDQLDDEHEIAIQLMSFGKDILLYVTDISFSNPSTLVFHGLVNGQNATLIQHMSMLSFLLLAVKKPEPAKPARRIGFHVDEKEPEK